MTSALCCGKHAREVKIHHHGSLLAPVLALGSTSVMVTASRLVGLVAVSRDPQHLSVTRGVLLR